MSQTLIHKKFVVYFSSEHNHGGFTGGEQVKLVTRGFFTVVNGFRPYVIHEVGKMEIDDILNVGEQTWPVKVWRVV